MAKINISFNCGCGFKTAELLEAIVHSDTHNHTLAATGEIVHDSKVITLKEVQVK